MKTLSLLFVVAGLIAAGCGSGDTSSASGPTVTTAPPKIDDPRVNPRPSTAPSNP